MFCRATSYLFFLGVLALGFNATGQQSENGKLIRAAKLQEDLDCISTKLQEIHPNPFSVISKEQFLFELNRAKQLVQQDMDTLSFWKIAAPLVVKIGDGHTFLAWPKTTKQQSCESRVFPFKMEIIGGEIVVQKNMSNTAEIQEGMILSSINDISVKDIITGLEKYIAGERQHFRHSLISNYYFNILLWAHFGFKDSFEVKAESNAGKKIEARIEGITCIEYNKRLAENKSGVNSGAKLFDYRLLDGNIALLEINGLVRYDDYKVFLDSAFSDIRKRKIRKLILDFRKNGGGDSRVGSLILSYLTRKKFNQFFGTVIKLSDDFKKSDKHQFVSYDSTKIGSDRLLMETFGNNKPLKIRNRFKGKAVLLVGPATFSGASSFTSAFQCYKIGKVIGQETGGLTVTYGDFLTFHLPNSKLNLGISTKKFIQACGKEDGKGVIPDLIVARNYVPRNFVNDKELDYAALVSKNPE